MFAGLFSNVNFYLVLTLVLTIVASGVYFKWSQDKFTKDARTILAHEITIETQNKTIETFGESIEQIKSINTELIDLERKNTKRAEQLSNTLLKLDNAASGKPGLVENLVNRAAKERNRCFEIASGAALEKDETNKVCPQLMAPKE